MGWLLRDTWPGNTPKTSFWPVGRNEVVALFAWADSIMEAMILAVIKLAPVVAVVVVVSSFVSWSPRSRDDREGSFSIVEARNSFFPIRTIVSYSFSVGLTLVVVLSSFSAPIKVNVVVVGAAMVRAVPVVAVAGVAVVVAVKRLKDES